MESVFEGNFTECLMHIMSTLRPQFLFWSMQIQYCMWLPKFTFKFQVKSQSLISVLTFRLFWPSSSFGCLHIVEN